MSHSVIDDRATRLGEYIVEHKATVRRAAKKFGVSKSTVHKDVSQRLKYIDNGLYHDVKDVLEVNKAQRHIRGGITRRKNKMPRGLAPRDFSSFLTARCPLTGFGDRDRPGPAGPPGGGGGSPRTPEARR